jgi:hypothetical protein
MSLLLRRSTKQVLSQVTLGLVAAFVMMLGASVSSTSAATPGPGWAIRSLAVPTNFSVRDNPTCEAVSERENCDVYLVTATNVGTRPSEGTIVVKGEVPAGLEVTSFDAEPEHEAQELEPLAAVPLFTVPLENCTASSRSYQCEYGNEGQSVPPGSVLEIPVKVVVRGGGEPSVTNRAEIEEGGAVTATTSEPSTVANTVNGETPSFGLQDFSVGVYGPNGASDAHAGDHPGALTTTIDYTTELDENGKAKLPHSVQEPKTETVNLPLGFVGDPLAAGQCSESALHGKTCPAGSEVGSAMIDRSGGEKVELRKVYNMVPEPGYPAMFGFEYGGINILMRARVLPSSSGYVLSVSVPDVARSTFLKVYGVTLMFFGDPAEQDGGSRPAAFFTNPTDCAAPPLKASIEMNSWVNPQHWVSKETSMYEASSTQGVSGCNMLQFNPTIALSPETTQADTPSGYEVNLNVPQAGNLYPILATPDLKNAEVTLPEGVAVSPGAADGLVGCRERGPEGIELGNEDTVGHEVQEGEELGPDGLVHPARGHCPLASQIGTVEVTTPVLANPLKGHVYLAQPKCGGEGQPTCTEADATNGNLYGLYLEAEGSGVIVKLRGTVSVNPSTGRLTTRFNENTQLPFSELKLQLTGGPRAPLANPQSCGEATTTSVLEPWSAPESGAPATPFSSFTVTGCASPMPFAPGFLAQTTTPTAGAFSPFTLTFSRHDREQDLAQITVQTPPGLLGKIAGIPQCPEAQANAGTCSPASQIGTASAAAGAGSHPFWVTGPVYLTGPYGGAPFGLSVVVPAKAGPFDLGNEIVRSAIHIDPNTSALTIVSDPLPQKLDGIPFRLQTVNVTVDRPGFMFNPTNCSQQAVTGTISGALPNGAPGSTVNVSGPFAVAGCAGLPFKPSFSASTQGKTSKANGASLVVKVAQKPGEANIHKVELQLPLALPSRLTTLHGACTEAQFNANPAGCPAASVIGTATAHTPLLNVPLMGPAYLVSHGGAAFPDVEFILQGEGVVIYLDGKTDIKKGITFSRFETVPDAPISSFETSLPEGPHSVLGANGKLCSQKLVMPTTIVGQNGRQVTQSTNIAVTGCGKPSIKITKAKIKGNTVLVTLTTTQLGTVIVSGDGLKTIKKTLAAGAHQLKVSLTKNGRTARKHHRKTKVKASVKDSNGSSSKTMTLTL